jgi:serine/threonine protein kinase
MRPRRLRAQITNSASGNFTVDVPIPETTFENTETRLEGQDQVLFLRFMRSMLEWLPEKRKTAKELLSDEWLNSPDLIE